MAEPSKFQEGVIRRYYQHFDTVSVQRLATIVSEIYLAEANKPVKLWEKAKALLSRVSAEDERVAEIIANKDIKALARLVNQLGAGLKDKKSELRDQTSEILVPKSAVIRESADVTDKDSQSAPSALAAAQSVPPSSPSTDPLSPDNLKRAMKAFRKRMKLTKLDDESRLGRSNNPMTGGRTSQVEAIMAPREFPKPIWDELVRQGKLRSSDGVFYELIEGA